MAVLPSRKALMVPSSLLSVWLMSFFCPLKLDCVAWWVFLPEIFSGVVTFIACSRHYKLIRFYILVSVFVIVRSRFSCTEVSLQAHLEDVSGSN